MITSANIGPESVGARQSPDVCIRRATSRDARRLAELLSELGYPVEAGGVPARLAGLERSGHVVLVAEIEAEIVAWIQIGMTPALVEPPTARILGLVVSERARGRGVGRRLVAAAEAWASERRFGGLGVTSNIIRSEAHGFYEHLGFARRKTQLVFAKTLPGPEVAERADRAPVAIRHARASDLATLLRLNAHVQSIHAQALPTLFKAVPDPDQIRSAFSAMLEKPESIWLLAGDEEPVGYGYAQLSDRPDAWLRPSLKVCTINQLVVAPDARRHGVARQLVDAITALAAARGTSRVELDVWSFNTTARHCFEALGFEVFNERMVRRPVEPSSSLEPGSSHRRDASGTAS